MARMAYADLDALDAGTKAILATRRSPSGNIFRMIANAGKVTGPYLNYGTELRKHLAIAIEIYEFAIVRVANLSRSAYVARQHEQFLRKNGVDEDKILALRMRPSLKHFTEAELAAIQFAEEVVLDVKVSDETFALAKKHYNEEQLMHLMLSTSHYMLACRIAETFEVDLQPADSPASS